MQEAATAGHIALSEACRHLEASQREADKLYSRWQELESCGGRRSPVPPTLATSTCAHSWQTPVLAGLRCSAHFPHSSFKQRIGKADLLDLYSPQ